MSTYHANHNSGVVQGSQNNVRGSFTDNSYTDRRQSYHQHTAPTNNYSTVAYGSNVINGDFSGTQYNGVPYPYQSSYTPPFTSNPAFTQEPFQMDGGVSSSGGEYADTHQRPPYDVPHQSENDELEDIFQAYDDPATHTQRPPPPHFWPPRQHPPRVPRAYRGAYYGRSDGQGMRSGSYFPANPNYRFQETVDSFAPDPPSQARQESYQGFNAGDPGYLSRSQSAFSSHPENSPAQSPPCFREASHMRQRGKETNPPRPMIQGGARNPQKSTTYYQ